MAEFGNIEDKKILLLLMIYNTVGTCNDQACLQVSLKYQLTPQYVENNPCLHGHNSLDVKTLILAASLHFSGHTFSISPCSSFVPTFDGKMRHYKDQSIATELAGVWGRQPPNIGNQKTILNASFCCRSMPYLGHIQDILSLSSKGELVE